MDVEQFFKLLTEEIQINTKLQNLYKFANIDRNFLFRKAYYCQRLEYIKNQISKKNSYTWDCGCGYGTTGIFLALNGFNVYGTTVEYFYDFIPDRFRYWSKYGDISSFKVEYKNIFDPPFSKNEYDYIIVQDVLHHLEPNKEALKILSDALKKGGSLIAIEENGNNVINNFKLFLRRGNKKIIDIYDDKQEKYIKLGNENIQSLRSWHNKLNEVGLIIDYSKLKYIRLYPPFVFNKNNYKKLLQNEQRIWRRNKLLKEYFYFGVNFTAGKE
jgi:SAM-dependent methyltransferase